MKGTNGFLMKAGKEISWLKYVVKFQEVIATVIVLYVFIRFLMFILKKDTVKVNTTISR